MHRTGLKVIFNLTKTSTCNATTNIDIIKCFYPDRPVYEGQGLIGLLLTDPLPFIDTANMALTKVRTESLN